MGTACAIDTSLHETDQAEECWPVTVQDISAGGLGLILGRRIEPGTVLTVEVHTADPDVSYSLGVTVKYVQPREFGHWFAGCTFPAPLSDEELRALL